MDQINRTAFTAECFLVLVSLTATCAFTCLWGPVGLLGLVGTLFPLMYASLIWRESRHG